MFGRRRKKPKKPGFIAEVRELYAATKAKMEAGRGRRSMIEAQQELAIKAGTVQADRKSDPRLDGPPGEPVRMSAKEYRRLMGLD